VVLHPDVCVIRITNEYHLLNYFCNFLYSLLLFLLLHLSVSKTVELYNGSVVLWISFILPAIFVTLHFFLILHIGFYNKVKSNSSQT
jgi:hypothetical protein